MTASLRRAGNTPIQKLLTSVLCLLLSSAWAYAGKLDFEACAQQFLTSVGSLQTLPPQVVALLHSYQEDIEEGIRACSLDGECKRASVAEITDGNSLKVKVFVSKGIPLPAVMKQGENSFSITLPVFEAQELLNTTLTSAGEQTKKRSGPTIADLTPDEKLDSWNIPRENGPASTQVKEPEKSPVSSPSSMPILRLRQQVRPSKPANEDQTSLDSVSTEVDAKRDSRQIKTIKLRRIAEILEIYSNSLSNDNSDKLAVDTFRKTLVDPVAIRTPATSWDAICLELAKIFNLKPLELKKALGIEFTDTFPIDYRFEIFAFELADLVDRQISPRRDRKSPFTVLIEKAIYAQSQRDKSMYVSEIAKVALIAETYAEYPELNFPEAYTKFLAENDKAKKSQLLRIYQGKLIRCLVAAKARNQQVTSFLEDVLTLLSKRPHGAILKETNGPIGSFFSDFTTLDSRTRRINQPKKFSAQLGAGMIESVVTVLGRSMYSVPLFDKSFQLERIRILFHAVEQAAKRVLRDGTFELEVDFMSSKGENHSVKMILEAFSVKVLPFVEKSFDIKNLAVQLGVHLEENKTVENGSPRFILTSKTPIQRLPFLDLVTSFNKMTEESLESSLTFSVKDRIAKLEALIDLANRISGKNEIVQSTSQLDLIATYRETFSRFYNHSIFNQTGFNKSAIFENMAMIAYTSAGSDELVEAHLPDIAQSLFPTFRKETGGYDGSPNQPFSSVFSDNLFNAFCTAAEKILTKSP